MKSIKRAIGALIAAGVVTMAAAAPAQAGLLVASAQNCATPTRHRRSSCAGSIL